MTRWIRGAGVIVAVAAAANACIKSPETALQRLLESRRLAADLHVQFTKAADASNRAVMADTDDASVAFAREATQASDAVRRDADTLGTLLDDLGYSEESGLLKEFRGRFGDYDRMNHTVLQLAVENTNLKAQRISFGPAREAAEAFRAALESVAAANPAKEAWHVKALAGAAVSDVREIEVLQAPHIAEASDVAMSDIEKQMKALEADARDSVQTLSSLAAPPSKKPLSDATAALDRFMTLDAQVIELSRRNTNVNSLSLALGQMRTKTASCDSTLTELQDALAKRGVTATR